MASWTDSDKDLIRTMWAMGTHSSDIAQALAGRLRRVVTRNSVMGVIDRIGLMGLGHADAARLSAIAKVSELMEEPFSMGQPLHREALLTILLVSHAARRDAETLSLASGVDRSSVSAFLERLPLVWPKGRAPARWMGGVEGNLAFILDMAVVAGRIEAPTSRPSSVANDAWSQTGARVA